jgi:DNA repair photolyase
MLIRYFDPWKGDLCTCPKKYSFNPYTGCEHKCVYCYITSYIPRGHEGRIKKNLLKTVMKEKKKLNPNIPISMSNSSDPYTPLEKTHKITRACLKILKDFKILIITKSDLVVRDADLLKNMRTSVSMTITTLDENLARKLEPHAPTPEKRLRAIHELIEKGIPVSCRIDPIIPGLNEDTKRIVKELSDIGVKHIVSSTFKPRYDSWKRFSSTFRDIAKELEELYFKKGSKHNNSYYLPRELRVKLMQQVKENCRHWGITFATCREGLPNEVTCDGSHLIKG